MTSEGWSRRDVMLTSVTCSDRHSVRNRAAPQAAEQLEGGTGPDTWWC